MCSGETPCSWHAEIQHVRNLRFRFEGDLYQSLVFGVCIQCCAPLSLKLPCTSCSGHSSGTAVLDETKLEENLGSCKQKLCGVGCLSEWPRSQTHTHQGFSTTLAWHTGHSCKKRHGVLEQVVPKTPVGLRVLGACQTP